MSASGVFDTPAYSMHEMMSHRMRSASLVVRLERGLCICICICVCVYAHAPVLLAARCQAVLRCTAALAKRALLGIGPTEFLVCFEGWGWQKRGGRIGRYMST
jgi:hypothetical protein